MNYAPPCLLNGCFNTPWDISVGLSIPSPMLIGDKSHTSQCFYLGRGIFLSKSERRKRIKAIYGQQLRECKAATSKHEKEIM